MTSDTNATFDPGRPVLADAEAEAEVLAEIEAEAEAEAEMEAEVEAEETEAAAEVEAAAEAAAESVVEAVAGVAGEGSAEAAVDVSAEADAIHSAFDPIVADADADGHAGPDADAGVSVGADADVSLVAEVGATDTDVGADAASPVSDAIDAIAAEFDALGDSPSMADVVRVSGTAPPPPAPAGHEPLTTEPVAGSSYAANQRLMARVQKALMDADPVVVSGKVTRASGIIVEAMLPQVAVGTACVIEVGEGRLISAEVVGFSSSKALLMPFGELAGIGEGCRVWPRASAAEIPVGEALLGRVVDAAIRPVDGLGVPSLDKTAALNAAPPPAMQRRRIARPLVLGIRSLDACLTCGEGQRVGIMAGPGVGKSVLLGMLARSASADIIVCGLVGERGREVREFVERDLGPAGLARSVVVVATADEPPLVRVRAAMAATAIAEFFRARGKKVLLLIDSLSRVAMAQREIGLAAGEPPTSRGYPPSVFAALPRLVERAGNDAGEGSITAMYTVLAEGDDMSDPVADAARAALDGHVVLSRKLANAGHFPAVDVLASVSRVMSDVVTPEHRRLATEAREVLSSYRDSADLIEVGAYVAGSNPRVDRALRSVAAVNALFRQEPGQRFTLDSTLLGLRRALETPVTAEAARG